MTLLALALRHMNSPDASQRRAARELADDLGWLPPETRKLTETELDELYPRAPAPEPEFRPAPWIGRIPVEDVCWSCLVAWTGMCLICAAVWVLAAIGAWTVMGGL